MHATCVDLTDVLGRGAPAAPAPAAQRGGPAARPDRPRRPIELVWSDAGYPARRRLPRLPPPHDRTTTGRGPTTARAYDPTRALALAREHAADFVARALVRRARGRTAALVRAARSTPSCSATGGTRGRRGCDAVSTRPRAQGLALAHARRRARAAASRQPRAAPSCRSRRGARRATSRPGRGPQVADLAWRARDAELRVVAAGARGRRRARCASCSRCRPATGRSWSAATLAGALRARARGRARRGARRGPRALGSAAPPRCATSRPFAATAPLLEP